MTTTRAQGIAAWIAATSGPMVSASLWQGTMTATRASGRNAEERLGGLLAGIVGRIADDLAGR